MIDSKLIKAYALEQAGLTEEEWKSVQNHPAFNCPCEVCRKSGTYFRVKGIITDWELFKVKESKSG